MLFFQNKALLYVDPFDMEAQRKIEAAKPLNAANEINFHTCLCCDWSKRKEGTTHCIHITLLILKRTPSQTFFNTLSITANTNAIQKHHVFV